MPTCLTFHHHTPDCRRGFTLIETLVSLVVAGVLMSMAVPGFNEMMQDNRQSDTYNKLSATLRYARSEAIKRSTGVTVCAYATAISCGTDWSEGLLVFQDSSSIGNVLTYDGNDLTLRVIPIDTGVIDVLARARLSGNSTATSTSAIRFGDRGQPSWDSGTLTICDARGAEKAKAMIITGSGMDRQAASLAESDTILDAEGNALSCS